LIKKIALDPAGNGKFYGPLADFLINYRHSKYSKTKEKIPKKFET
jgi:hypothetical protein